jgi:hypothetical protein
MLSNDQLRSLASGEGRVYHFDLSRIPGEFYEPLLRTLQHFTQKNIESLGFTCDDLLKAEQNTLSGQPPPVSLSTSIIKTKSRAIQNVVALLAHVLPQSTRLLEIVLTGLTFDNQYLSKVISSIGRSTSLESISFTRIQLGREGLRGLLSVCDPNQIKSITLSGCGIGSASTPDILEFIRRKDDRMAQNGGIQVFAVLRPSLGEEDARAISVALDGDLPSPIHSPIRSPGLQTRPVQTDRVAEAEFLELEELERENAALKDELLRLRRSIDAVEFKEDVFIVGKGAEAFVNFIGEMEAKLAEFEGVSRPS